MNVNVVSPEETSLTPNSTPEPHSYSLFALQKDFPPQQKPMAVTLTLDGVPVLMQVDTGATVSIISQTINNSMERTTDTKTLQLKIEDLHWRTNTNPGHY